MKSNKNLSKKRWTLRKMRLSCKGFMIHKLLTTYMSMKKSILRIRRRDMWGSKGIRNITKTKYIVSIIMSFLYEETCKQQRDQYKKVILWKRPADCPDVDCMVRSGRSLCPLWVFHIAYIKAWAQLSVDSI